METQSKNTSLERPRQGRNIALGIYVIASTTFVAAYTLVQFFTTI